MWSATAVSDSIIPLGAVLCSTLFPVSTYIVTDYSKLNNPQFAETVDKMQEFSAPAYRRQEKAHFWVKCLNFMEMIALPWLLWYNKII